MADIIAVNDVCNSFLLQLGIHNTWDYWRNYLWPPPKPVYTCFISYQQISGQGFSKLQYMIFLEFCKYRHILTLIYSFNPLQIFTNTMTFILSIENISHDFWQISKQSIMFPKYPFSIGLQNMRILIKGH